MGNLLSGNNDEERKRQSRSRSGDYTSSSLGHSSRDGLSARLPPVQSSSSTVGAWDVHSTSTTTPARPSISTSAPAYGIRQQQPAVTSLGSYSTTTTAAVSTAGPVRASTSTTSSAEHAAVAHAHTGHARREERDINRRELHEAVKYGLKQPTNPGRHGDVRWRYTYKDVVYITDETSRHEITSWRVNGVEEPLVAIQEAGEAGAHVVVVVDCSGSMRNNDVPGYPSRIAAVYDCLARELVEPQLRLVAATDMLVSLVEMSDGARVVKNGVAADEALLQFLRHRGATIYARSHGNYLPSLETVLQLLTQDAHRQRQLFLIFLSDGAPSDHTEMACPHRVQVWQPCPSGRLLPSGRPLLRNCVARDCRPLLIRKVHSECVQMVKRIGDVCGRDRTLISTVAFGPPTENYAVLRDMAGALPRGSFLKLGLSAACLKESLSSLSSSLTLLRTDLLGLVGLTLRKDILGMHGPKEVIAPGKVVSIADKWNVFLGAELVSKQRYDMATKRMVDVPLSTPPAAWTAAGYTVQGGAQHRLTFAEGAERVVFQCSEAVAQPQLVEKGEAKLFGCGLVAKEAKHQQTLLDPKFHQRFCRVQCEADALAVLFNRRLAGGKAWQVQFLTCLIYTVQTLIGRKDILVEVELDGKWTKWNDNRGGVSKRALGPAQSALHLGAIAEDEEEEEDGEGDSEGSSAALAALVPQCFSHFTYSVTDGKQLVCDLQGVWNAVDGYTLTDPAVHSMGQRNGHTDKGVDGMRSFFATHQCNALCHRLGLQSRGYCASDC